MATSLRKHFVISGILVCICLPSSRARPSHNPEINESRQQVAGGPTLQEGKKFTLTRMANGVTKDGAPFSQNTFERGSSEKVYVVMIHFSSSESVRKEFATRLKAAVTIVEQKTLSDKNGSKEERAVATFKTKDGRIVTSILITSGTVLREIQSFSAQNALEFEKEATAN